MKLNKILLCILSFCALNASVWSQDYQTFRSTDVHYFRENNEGMMLASQIVGKMLIAGDSIFYPFKSFRFDSPYYDGLLTSGWMGKKIIVQPDGLNLFFNKDLDTITINTQAEIGESFTFYNYDSGTTIEATVVSIEEEMVLDVLDTVKTFVLSSDEPSFDFEEHSFRIGKNAGILDVFPFYSFPEKYAPMYGNGTESESYQLVGQLYPRKGITKPTKSDVRNLNVGDVLQYTKYNSEWVDEFWTRRLTVLSKVAIGLDGAYFTLEQYEHHHRVDYSDEDNPYYDAFSTTIINYSADLSDDFITEQLIPEKDYRKIFSGIGYNDYSFALVYNEPCGFKEVFRSEGSWLHDEFDPTGTVGEPRVRKFTHVSNGLYSYSSFLIAGYDYVSKGESFSSSIIDGTICGSGNFLSTEKEEKEKVLKVYPNPTNGNFNVNIVGLYDVQLYTIDGRLVYTKSQQSSPQIELKRDIPNGTYFLVITKNQKMYNEKIIVNN
jgi:hypothetical protein